MQIKLPRHAIIKGAITGAAVAIVVVAIAAGLRFVFPPSLAAQDDPSGHIQIAQLIQSPTVNGDCNVTGSGNTINGGINCPKAGPNPPTFEIGEQTLKPRVDGTFDLVVTTNLKSQTMVQLLYVSVDGADVLSFDFQPQMGGAYAYWYGKMNDTGAKALGFTNPQPGPYLLTIHTSKKPAPANGINIRYNIVPN
jgi:hypothetical protein